MTFTLPSPAKLNLFLHIVGRREDGYHNLETLFQFVDAGDELAFEAADELTLSPAIEGVAFEDNLIIKAARALQQHTHTNKGATITLHKVLPMGAGLGGGSSNAATTLLALNELWDLQLSVDTLADIGLKLGADVPVFVRGFAAFAQGVGEVLQPLEPSTPWYLIVTPKVHVDTRTMFNHPDLTRNTPSINICAALNQAARNDFEPLVRALHPQIDSALKLLDNLSNPQTGQAVMSGSGASVFAPFADQASADQAQTLLHQRAKESGLALSSFVARGINKSPAHTALEQLP